VLALRRGARVGVRASVALMRQIEHRRCSANAVRYVSIAAACRE
jgi:hypothetical protein